ncbi:MAG: peptidyl-prolyl cis-trans isomerase, partial [Flavobacteriaceae bacterium]|nr:peptidyl-prolyl cis-trans isomerase [Flavobacteriaceae bacterium]
SNFTQLQDSLGVYLVKIEDILLTNDIAPLIYVEPTIKQIILNKRKLELIKNLERDITKDALKNKKFEIYTNQ